MGVLRGKKGGIGEVNVEIVEIFEVWKNLGKIWSVENGKKIVEEENGEKLRRRGEEEIYRRIREEKGEDIEKVEKDRWKGIGEMEMRLKKREEKRGNEGKFRRRIEDGMGGKKGIVNWKKVKDERGIGGERIVVKG